MKQSDVLTFAINGVQRELKEAEAEVDRIYSVLEELKAFDIEESAIDRPPGSIIPKNQGE